MLRKLWVLPIDIRLAAHTNKLRFRPRSYSWIGNVPGPRCLRQADHRLERRRQDPVRQGHRQPSAARSVAADAARRARGEARLARPGLLPPDAARLQQRGSPRSGSSGRCMSTSSIIRAARQVTRDDPRVTRVGRFIRKTSLDELPQLFNVVFSGTLSLVGPRPHAVHALARGAPLRRSRRRLFRAPPRASRHHRLGADPRLARRDRHAGKNPEARRMRPLSTSRTGRSCSTSTSSP